MNRQCWWVSKNPNCTRAGPFPWRSWLHKKGPWCLWQTKGFHKQRYFNSPIFHLMSWLLKAHIHISTRWFKHLHHGCVIVHLYRTLFTWTCPMWQPWAPAQKVGRAKPHGSPMRIGSNAISYHQSLTGKMPQASAPQSVTLTATAAAARSLWEMHILRLHPRPTESKSLGVGIYLNKLFPWFFC